MNRTPHMTPQRRLVYDLLCQTPDHPTAADVMERLRLKGEKLAYATVYNSLRYLTETGVIQELTVGTGAARYDAQLEPHQHIVCEACGRVDEVFGIDTSAYAAVVQQKTGYVVGPVNIVAKGLCPDCAAKASHTPR